ncbi:hypothetical protein [Bradyrhizobium sp. 6(2017)]|uniref:hypothetical protein n=1 Tax=Bradyrhizobium sp. 6(2017) TaxID=1197460 RepID=UPI0013E10C94|nr:hypothetical protein [Bradyrhizobium sp. 6(2017)]QIG97736.1 hypothetical protein G6P99_38975 [Bradyrhizobium sp. 6(2017)]
MSEELYDGMLDAIPPNPARAKNYVELLALMKEQQKIAERGVRQSPDDFWMDQKGPVVAHCARAIVPSGAPILPSGPQDPDIPHANRLNRLIKIRVHRQGLKMTNGFNG